MKMLEAMSWNLRIFQRMMVMFGEMTMTIILTSRLIQKTEILHPSSLAGEKYYPTFHPPHVPPSLRSRMVPLDVIVTLVIWSLLIFPFSRASFIQEKRSRTWPLFRRASASLLVNYITLSWRWAVPVSLRLYKMMYFQLILGFNRRNNELSCQWARGPDTLDSDHRHLYSSLRD